MCSGVVPQHPPTMLTKPLAANSAQDLRRFARGLLVFAERVRQTRVRIGAYMGVGDARELLDIRTQLFAAERAVEAHSRRTHVTHGVPECLGRLAGQCASGCVGDRSRHDDRQIDPELIERLADGEQRRLGIQRIEYRLDQEHVHAALDERAGGARIAPSELLEVDVAEGRDR